MSRFEVVLCCRGLTVSVALYSHSLLLLSEVAQDGRSKLLITARDMTIPPVGSSVTNGASSGLREAVGELEMLVPGERSTISSSGHYLCRLSKRSRIKLTG